MSTDLSLDLPEEDEVAVTAEFPKVLMFEDPSLEDREISLELPEEEEDIYLSLKGFKTIEELQKLLDKIPEGIASVPLKVYPIDSDEAVPIGNIGLSLELILQCNYYKYQINMNYPDKPPIDLSNGDNLYNFYGTGGRVYVR